MLLSKIIRLLKVLLSEPGEFLDRVSMSIERRLPSRGHTAPALRVEKISIVSFLSHTTVTDFLQEDALAALEAEIVAAQQELAIRAPFNMAHSADYSLARLCYAVCRATRPRIVVETGVAYGVTSAFVLKALEMNGSGELWSIDLPPLVEDNRRFQGVLVPHDFRRRWHLLTGASRRLLPAVIRQLGAGIDVFIHDSLHTHRNMLREFRMAWPVLNGTLISDDVEQNSAFAEFVSSVRPALAFVIQEEKKDAAFGVAVKDSRWLARR